MRTAIAAALLAAIVGGVTRSAISAPQASVRLSISHTRFSPDPEAAHLPKGLKEWDTTFVIHVRGSAPCGTPRVATWLKQLHNRRPIGTARHEVRAVDPQSSAVKVGVGAYPGEVFSLAARAVCRPHTYVSKVIRTTARVPLFSCDQGPWLVSRVQRRAWVQDDKHLRRFLRLAKGDVLPGTDFIRTGRGGTLIFGARRCHGLGFTLRPRSSGTVGAYSRRGNGGESSVHGRMRARLDRHAKGVGFDNGTPVWARPAGDDAATMELASRSQAKATIRVLSGHVVVLDQKEVLARLTRGQSVIVRCTNYTDCTAEAG